MKQLLVCVAMALAATACSENGSPTDPSQVNIEYSVTDLVMGTGPEAVAGNQVSVNYTLWLYSGSGTESKGTRIESSLDPGGAPISFVVSVSNIIRGFNQAVLGMRVGGRRRAYIPSNLGYGAQGSANGTIPPNAALVFEIELVTLVQ